MKLFPLASLLILTAANAGELEFEELIAKMESDVLDLARVVEDLYSTQSCNPSSFAACRYGNYDECRAIYPSTTCPAGDQLAISACGDGTTCSALYDYGISTVRIPEELATGVSGNPQDPSVIESICFTRTLDDYFIQKREQDKSYWTALGVDSPSMYFGSITGSFRIYPARQIDQCNSYDPRIRPWYIAGSAGPKNVVLVLDTSGSMETDNRFGSMQEAAKQIISTLTVSDRIAIVPFQQTAQLIADEDGFMFTATQENKDMLIGIIDSLEAIGPTNFYDAFTNAFDVLTRTAQQELTKDCNSAILFLTDGKMTHPANVNETDVVNLVNNRINDVEALTGRPVILFTYSVAYEDEADIHTFPKQLACSTKYGVWSKIDEADEIFDSLTSYYRLFSLGLGDDQNDSFTAWVEPFAVRSGGSLASTVSAPVYDRSKDPPIFLGVVAIELRLAAVQEVLEDVTDEVAVTKFQSLALRSAARCPTIDLQLCVLESFRRQGKAGDFAMCSSNCTTFDLVQVEALLCPFVEDYPANLWTNVLAEGWSYEKRVCCAVGGTESSGVCPASSEDESKGESGNSTTTEGSSPSSSGSTSTSLGTGAIVGIVVAVVVLIGLVVVGYCWRKKKCQAGGVEAPDLRFQKATAPPEHLLHS